MSLVDSIRDHVREHRSGMVSDLLFALVWVTLVELFFRFVDGPQWAYYMFMLAGILAYFGFFWSLELAREQQ
ncbi:hypothetical protein BV210_15970 [Halorientalis sp. IM1011]|uniref:hypothetical protein n=1 Tax=Halorientalis sp. IM1011 TaxID=1932360 RepID=UPI00097CD41F|nr:hypothetical protein [Halorientalis sp. IM1011]AQL44110.1 hypothetical protein BV210_15970 [Halorientalis sp. IM1011]